MGSVYRARDLHFPNITKLVAVKEMINTAPDPLVRQTIVLNFEREANLLATLTHPSIPRIYDYFTEEDRSYLVLEFIHGKDLEAIISDTNGFLSEEQVLAWAIQLCDVLVFPARAQAGSDHLPRHEAVQRHDRHGWGHQAGGFRHRPHVPGGAARHDDRHGGLLAPGAVPRRGHALGRPVRAGRDAPPCPDPPRSAPGAAFLVSPSGPCGGSIPASRPSSRRSINTALSYNPAGSLPQRRGHEGCPDGCGPQDRRPLQGARRVPVAPGRRHQAHLVLQVRG